MIILNVLRCEHGAARQWHVEAMPNEPAPTIEYCEICDAETIALDPPEDATS